MNSCLTIPLLASALALAVPAAADERPDGPVQGGTFRDASWDSLGYDDFRQLNADYQLERRQSARRWLRRAVDRANESAATADSDWGASLLLEAIDACATAVGLAPYLPEAWLQYAQHLNANGRYADAKACLRQFETTLRYERRKGRREELQQKAHATAARVAFNRGDSEGSRAEAERALELDSSDEETRLVLVRALIDQKRFDEARRAVAAFDERGPFYARALAVQAVLEMRDGRLERAEEVFSLAHEYGMRGAVFDNDRGLLYLEMGRTEDAVSSFESAYESVPSFHEARNNLAVAHRRAGRLDDADRVLQDLLEEYPDYGAAHFNRAEILRSRFEFSTDESERSALRAAAFTHYSAALASGYEPEFVIERRAELSVYAEDLEQAERDLLRMTEDPSVDGRVLFLLGRVKKEQGRLDIAFNLLQMAQQRGYLSGRSHAEMGEILARRGDLEGARDALTTAIELDPSLLVTRVNLSVVLAQLGDVEQASAVLDEAEGLAPDHPLVRRQRAALSRRAPIREEEP